eukprot:s13_g4.t1
MGNSQCCCDESDAKEGLPDGTVMVWRPEATPKRAEPSSAELLRKDKQLEKVMDKLVQLQPSDEHPGPQKVPKAVLVDARHPAHLTPAETCFIEKTASPTTNSREEGSTPCLDDASAASSALGRDPSPVQMPQMQWVSKYDGEVAQQGKGAAKEAEAPPGTSQPTSTKRVSVKELLQESAPAKAPAPQVATASPKQVPAAQPPTRQAPVDAPAEATKPVQASKVDVPQTSIPETPPPKHEKPVAKAPPAPPAATTTVAAAATLAKPAAPAETSAAADAEPVFDEADLDVPYVTVQFKLPDGTLHDVYFLTFPFGFDLNKTKPITVRNVRPGSHAEDLGVQVGWSIQTVGETDVSNMDARGLLMVFLEQKKKLEAK